MLRIAGLLHATQHHGFLDFTEVSVETMENTVEIGEYFLKHVKATYSIMSADPVNKQGEYLLDAIKRCQISKFSRKMP